MSEQTRVIWKDGMAFDVELQGHRFTVDASSEFGGRDLGPRPKALLLPALAGCTAMDVVSILDKMRVRFDAFNVEVNGELSADHPKVFQTLHIVYRLRGEQIDRAKVEKAVVIW